MGNFSNTEVPFLDINLSITHGMVSTKIYGIPDDFEYDIVNFLFLYFDVQRRPSQAQDLYILPEHTGC